MKKRVSIKEVAKEAGVSIATVSYVLNNKENVKITPETTKKVRTVAKNLGYVRNLAASSLVSKRSRMLGVVIPQNEEDKGFMFGNPFHGDFLSSVEYTARNNGYHVLIAGSDKNHSYIDIAKNRDLDGIIIVGMYQDEISTELRQLQIPIVLVDSYCMDHYFHSVSINDRHGGYLATEYLIRKGHRRIAFISGNIENKGVDIRRFEGYKDAMEEAGLAIDRSLIITGTVGYEFGMEAASQLAKMIDIDKKNKGETVTAAFATADVLAVGLIKGLHRASITVPDDISVVGFDDVFLSSICTPSLTTIHQDISAKGSAAIEIITNQATRNATGKRDIILPLTLIERDSVKSI